MTWPGWRIRGRVGVPSKGSCKFGSLPPVKSPEQAQNLRHDPGRQPHLIALTLWYRQRNRFVVHIQPYLTSRARLSHVALRCARRRALSVTYDAAS